MDHPAIAVSWLLLTAELRDTRAELAAARQEVAALRAELAGLFQMRALGLGVPQVGPKRPIGEGTGGGGAEVKG